MSLGYERRSLGMNRVTGDIIAFSPPLIANDSHVDAVVSILSDALKRAA